MKNKLISLRIFIIAVVASILSVLIFVCNLKLKKSDSLSISCVRQEFQLNDEWCDAHIDYPQLSGMEDEEKEKRLNIMIEKDAMKVLERERNGGTIYSKPRI